MNENLRKILIYFKKWDDYWKLTDFTENTTLSYKNIDRYPLDFKPRVAQGHYSNFDDQGIPRIYSKKRNKFIYHYTTMFSYALAKSDLYLISGDNNHLRNVISIADYILKTGVFENNSFVLKAMDDSGKHSGQISAMVQGEGISVLCRAYEFTKESGYIEVIDKMVFPFSKSIENSGVIGFISRNQSGWYEEYTIPPLRHVLNGMIYSLWGLIDHFKLTGSYESEDLFKNGISHIENTLPYFDTGYWSKYGLSENGPDYIASMMYHNLHICQLTALFRETQIDCFMEYAQKFLQYSENFGNRIKAANKILIRKIFH